MIMNDVLHATSPQSTRPFNISVFDVLGVGMGFHVKDAQKERGPDDGTGVGQTGRQAGRQAGRRGPRCSRESVRPRPSSIRVAFSPTFDTTL